ncbi:MAG: nucleotidyl transferase AbiEii/AbiGii toxin family protein [Gammaproteobacteria bacterium]
MSLFDQLVNEAMRNQDGLAPLRMVVEKELLHHDILREMSSAGLLASLTFIGGTCLRACYGSSRLSEDLDFTGGADFSRESLMTLAAVLVARLQGKYGLRVEVSEPTRETGNIDTWKLKVQTRPGERDLSAQRINIDICAIPSHEPRPMMLRNHYGVDMGTAGLILQAQSREEILVDKLVAFALRPNRLKNRDLWDIAWLHQQGVVLPQELLPLKLRDHHCNTQRFLELLAERRQALLSEPQLYDDFRQEMRRFLPAALVAETVEQPAFWSYLTALVSEQCQRVSDLFSASSPTPRFRM